MDINRASAEELQRAFEVDGERSRYIVDTRNRLGGFENWDQIKEVVPSIDDKMVENLRAAGLTIGRRSEGGERHRPEHTGSESHSHSDERHDQRRSEPRESKNKESESRRSAGSERTDSGSRDVNSVSVEELKRVCQIDGERATYFTDKRRELGGFSSWEQIKDVVPSFDDGMVERLEQAGYRVGSRAA